MECYEAIATLTAAAMDTKRIRLGSGVYCLVYRNPALLAKSLTTIDHPSNGRVDCGLGAGWHAVEADAHGDPCAGAERRRLAPNKAQEGSCSIQETRHRISSAAITAATP